MEPPDTIPNSEVKRFSADGSVGHPHVRVGHRQAPNTKPQVLTDLGFFYWLLENAMTYSRVGRRAGAVGNTSAA